MFPEIPNKESMPVYKKKWPQYQLRDVDMCLYKLLSTIFNLKIISKETLEYGCTCNTHLLDEEEL